MTLPDAPDKSDPSLERRRAKRFSLGCPARLRWIGQDGATREETGEVENLSSGGALIYISRKVAVPAKMEVFVRAPFKGERWMKYPAMVLRVDNAIGRTGIAVKFATMRPRFVAD